MTEPADNEKTGRDWRVSATLLAVWAVAIFYVWRGDFQIPLSMLAMASVFFIMLIPAMNDLVRSIERAAFGEPDKAGSGTDEPPGGDSR